MRYRPEKNWAVTSRPTISAGRTRRCLISLRPMCISSITKAAVAELKEMKRTDPRETKSLLGGKTKNQSTVRSRGDVQVRVRTEIVDPGANTEAVFQHQQPDSQSESPTTNKRLT